MIKNDNTCYIILALLLHSYMPETQYKQLAEHLVKLFWFTDYLAD